ncbi:unnamed protein product [Soboliphyme baturini]|uniref:Coil containing protein n=1 Tax=Soboliphyme baturini TaxID=241478 RepID=A0A183J6X4_9BILA|nr:unnamed protein product [Soboliphyme baturini]
MEETLKQARKACEAWKREADDQRLRAQLAEFEKSQAIKERDSALTQLAYVQLEMQMMQLGNVSSGGIDFMNHYQLEQLKRKLYSEIDKIEKQLQQNSGPMCARCGRHVNDKMSTNACSVCCPGGKTNGHFTAVS